MPKTAPRRIYYFADGHRRRGPFTLDEIRQYPLRTNTLVWREGLKAWTELTHVPELWAIFAEQLVDPPPEALAYQVPEPPDPAVEAEQAALLATVPQTPFFGPEMNGLRDGVSEATRSNPLAIVAAALGALALTAWCLPWGMTISAVAAVAAIATGEVARRRARRAGGAGRAWAVAGLSLGGIGLTIAAIVLLFAAYFAATTPFPDRPPPQPAATSPAGARP